MDTFFYRFRPTDALLSRFQELDKQEIYFAPPGELNDPLDGLKNIFWKGDQILWAGLLKHYILCLTLMVLEAVRSSDNAKILDQNFVFSTEDDLRTPALRQLYGRVRQFFFSHEDIVALPGLLGMRRSPLRRNELIAYLRMLHLHAMNAVLVGIEEIMPSTVRPADHFLRTASRGRLGCRQCIEALIAQERDKPDTAQFAEAVAASAESLAEETNLLLAYRHTSFASGTAWKAVIFDFPSRYVSSLELLLYRDWYTACLVEDPDNAAMWGIYGDGHRGMCLKFKTHANASGKPCLRLTEVTGWGSSGPIPGEVFHECQRVEYRSTFVEIDFFRSLGMLTIPMLNFWARDEKGNASIHVLDILSGDKAWHQQYWTTFEQVICTKLSDWTHEKERRVTLHGLGGFDDKSRRKLKYRFEDLQGIIFGLNTPIEEKTDVMRIVEAKCKATGRNDFEFYQAFYSPEKGKMAHHQLNRIKFV